MLLIENNTAMTYKSNQTYHVHLVGEKSHRIYIVEVSDIISPLQNVLSEACEWTHLPRSSQ